MSQPFRVGIAGLVDDRVWPLIEAWRQVSDVVVVAAGDPESERLARAHDQFGISRLYPSWKEMLVHEELHFVQVGLEPGRRAELVEEASPRGSHLLLIGPLAASLDQADRILTAGRLHGCRMAVEWEYCQRPAIHQVAHLLQEERLGPLLRVHYHIRLPVPSASQPRAAWRSDPRLSGGGAIVYGCGNGIHLCRALIGVPTAVMGLTAPVRTHDAIDEQATVALAYTAMMATIEAAAAEETGYRFPELVIEGERGSLVLDSSGLRHWTDSPEILEVAGDPPSAPAELVHAALYEQEVEGFRNPQIARDAQEILDAARLASDHGRSLRLPLR